MLVSIPTPGRKASASSSRPRPSDTHQRAGEDFRTSTPINTVRGSGSRSNRAHRLGETSTPSAAFRTDPLPRFPSPRVHKRTRPRVSLGDFHDQPPNLIDVEHEYSRIAPGGLMEDTLLEEPDRIDKSPRASSPFAPFSPEEDADDLDLDLDFGVDENMLDPSSIISLHPKRNTRGPHRDGPPVELESEVEAEEHDTYALAKCYFDTKELERCRRVLQRCRSKKAMFLRLYAVYLVSPNVSGPRGKVRSESLMHHVLV